MEEKDIFKVLIFLVKIKFYGVMNFVIIFFFFKKIYYLKYVNVIFFVLKKKLSIFLMFK